MSPTNKNDFFPMYVMIKWISVHCVTKGTEVRTQLVTIQRGASRPGPEIAIDHEHGPEPR